MTFYETFSAEQLFLQKAKMTLEPDEDGFDSDIELGNRTVAIISCAFALEALLNLLFRYDGRIRFYESMDIKAKLMVLGELANVEVVFDRQPWQVVPNLIKTRNWLVHFKEPSVGFLGSCGYIENEVVNIPKLAPHKSLTRSKLKEYYDNILLIGQSLAKGLGLREEFGYLWTQEYEPWIVG